MRKALFLCWLISFAFAHAQVPKSPDSLKVFLKTQPHDTLYVLALNEHAFQIVQQGKYDEAKKIIAQMEALSKKFNYGDGFYKTMNMRGIVEYSKQEPEKAMAYFLKCNAIIQKYKLPKKIYQNSLNNIGVIYEQMGDRDNATLYAMKLIGFQEKNKLNPLKTFPYGLIGSNLKFYKKYDEALVYFRKCLALETRYKNYTGMAIAENNIGNVYDDLRNDAAAISHYETGLKYATAADYKLLQSDFLTNLGRMYVHQKAYAKAHGYLVQSERICLELGSSTSLTTIYNSLGNIYFFEENYGPAEVYYLKGLKTAAAMNKPEQLYIANQALAELKEKTGDFKAAYYYKVASETQKDSTFKLETAKNTEDLLRKYETEKKEQEIALKTLQISNYNKQKWYFISGILLLGIIGSLLFYQSRSRKRTNQKLQCLNTELDDANKVKARLFGIISHDLRSPISQIYQFLNLQQSDPELFSEADKIRHNERISVAANAVLETMEDLLIWSKTQMQQFTARNEKVNLAQCLETIAELLESQLAKKKLTLAISMPSDLSATTDKSMLTIILRNLLQNAITYSPENSAISVSANPNGTTSEITITDQGYGMPEHIRKTFEQIPTQIDSNTSGLGLSLVKEMSDLIGAKISISDHVPTGTRITLQLPR